MSLKVLIRIRVTRLSKYQQGGHIIRKLLAACPLGEFSIGHLVKEGERRDVLRFYGKEE